jgi:hypothetical protein
MGCGASAPAASLRDKRSFFAVNPTPTPASVSSSSVPSLAPGSHGSGAPGDEVGGRHVQPVVVIQSPAPRDPAGAPPSPRAVSGDVESVHAIATGRTGSAAPPSLTELPPAESAAGADAASRGAAARDRLLAWNDHFAPLLFPAAAGGRSAPPREGDAPAADADPWVHVANGAQDAQVLLLRSLLADAEEWQQVAALPVGRPALAAAFASLARDRLVHGDAAALRRLLCQDGACGGPGSSPAAVAGLRAWMDAPALSTSRPCAFSFAAAANYHVPSTLAPLFVEGATLGGAQPDAPLHSAMPALPAHLSWSEEAEHHHETVFLSQPLLRPPHIPGAVGWGGEAAPLLTLKRMRRQPTQTPLFAAVDTWAQHPPWRPAGLPSLSTASATAADSHPHSPASTAATTAVASTAIALGSVADGSGAGGGMARGCWDDVHVYAPYQLQPHDVFSTAPPQMVTVQPPLPPWHHARTLVQALAR